MYWTLCRKELTYFEVIMCTRGKLRLKMQSGIAQSTLEGLLEVAFFVFSQDFYVFFLSMMSFYSSNTSNQLFDAFVDSSDSSAKLICRYLNCIWAFLSSFFKVLHSSFHKIAEDSMRLLILFCNSSPFSKCYAIQDRQYQQDLLINSISC